MRQLSVVTSFFVIAVAHNNQHSNNNNQRNNNSSSFPASRRRRSCSSCSARALLVLPALLAALLRAQIATCEASLSSARCPFIGSAARATPTRVPSVAPACVISFRVRPSWHLHLANPDPLALARVSRVSSFETCRTLLSVGGSFFDSPPGGKRRSRGFRERGTQADTLTAVSCLCLSLGAASLPRSFQARNRSNRWFSGCCRI